MPLGFSFAETGGDINPKDALRFKQIPRDNRTPLVVKGSEF